MEVADLTPFKFFHELLDKWNLNPFKYLPLLREDTSFSSYFLSIPMSIFLSRDCTLPIFPFSLSLGLILSGEASWRNWKSEYLSIYLSLFFSRLTLSYFSSVTTIFLGYTANFMLFSFTNCFTNCLWGGIDIVYEGINNGSDWNPLFKKSWLFICDNVALVFGFGSKINVIKFFISFDKGISLGKL